MALVGLAERPWVDLRKWIDTSAFPEVHDEICRGLVDLELTYTGGSSRSLGILPKARLEHELIDYGEVFASMSDDELDLVRSLADGAPGWDTEHVDRDDIGEDKRLELSVRQYRYLEYRHGVFFPWKAHFPIVDANFADKQRPGHAFSPAALELLPKTVELLRSLPLKVLGRCILFGMDAYDHAGVHNDNSPSAPPHEFIMLVPNADKRLYLWDEADHTETVIDSPAYWFNDADYHGVHADPHFRYSLRVDGVFTDEFRRQVWEHARRR